MNKYVKQLIESYYEELNPKHIIRSRHDNMSIEYIIKNLIFNNQEYNNILLEEYHLVNIFNKTIDDIIIIYNETKNNLNKEIYTGWNYSIKNKTCTKRNNQNIDIPIYIFIVYDAASENTYAAILDNSNKIVIELNQFSIEQQCKDKTNFNEFIKDCLMHELFHAREMFALPEKNILLSKKNRVISSYENNAFSWDTYNKYFDMAKLLCDVLSDSEIRARLNAVNYKLNNIPDNNIKKYTNRNDLIIYCLEQTNDVSLYQDAVDKIKLLNLIAENAIFALEPIIYYCHKYNIIKTNLSSYNFKDKKPVSQYSYDIQDLIYAGLFEIEYKMSRFKRRLMNIIYHSLSKRNLI